MLTVAELLLDAGADPNRLAPADLYGSRYAEDPPWPSLHAAIHFDCPADLVELLLRAGVDPNTPGPDGRTPHQLAARQGRADLARLVRRHGARASDTEVDLFLAACLHGDRPAAERTLSRGRVRLDQLTDADRGAVVRAAEAGNLAAVRLMLDLGFPIDVRGADDGGTALHAAAYAGSADTVQLLIDHGADLEARDTTWDSTPLVWALVGSGEQPGHNPDPDWPATVRALIEAGASTDGVTVSPDDEKPPSREVADLLRRYGIGDE